VISFLRWCVVLSTLMALVLFIAILVIGKGLASAYRSGSGTEDFLKSVAPVAIFVLVCGMLASAFLPKARIFLRVVAAGVIAAMAGCATLLVSHTGEALFYMAFFALWLAYYAAILMNCPSSSE
jgi:hypothetical protein